MAAVKRTAAEQRVRREDRLAEIRLRVAIGSELEPRGIAAPAAVGAALGMPAAEAQGLLTRRPAPSSGRPTTTCGHAGDPGRDHLMALDMVGAAV